MMLRIIKHPAVRIAVPLVIAVIVVFALHRFATHVTWNDVKADLVAASPVLLLKALAFTALSFVGISLYDALAVNLVAPSKGLFALPHWLGEGWLPICSGWLQASES